jgi:hypothetical protein
MPISTTRSETDPNAPEVKCCLCFELKTGINLIMCVGILDMINMFGNILYSAYYNNVLNVHQDMDAY